MDAPEPAEASRASESASGPKASEATTPPRPGSPEDPNNVPDPGYEYNPIDTSSNAEAIQWQPGAETMSPTEANANINEGYAQLDQEMTSYLGDPPMPNWTTFGKFASPEAGRQMANLEDLKLAQSGDPAAMRRLAENMTTPEALKQMVAMSGGQMEDVIPALGRYYASLAANGADNKATVALQKELAEAIGTPDNMLDALTRGNNGIFDNFAPAYDAFLRGEADGGKGMEALAAAGYTPGSEKDPQGFFTKALSQYKEARQLGLQAEAEKDPAKKAELLKQREALINDSNLTLGDQEQAMVIQSPQVFGNPAVRENIQALGGTMSITDAAGGFDLLPNGGDWSSFQERMGYREVSPDTPGARKIEVAGETHYFQVDPNAEGTISHYFNDRTSDPVKRQQVMDGKPGPVRKPPMSDADLGIQLAASVPRLASYSADYAAGMAGDVSQAAAQQGQSDVELSMTPGLDPTSRRVLQAAAVGDYMVSEAGRHAENGLEAVGDGLEVVGDGVEAAGRAIKEEVQSRVMPWNPRAKWWFGMRNPFS